MECGLPLVAFCQQKAKSERKMLPSICLYSLYAWLKTTMMMMMMIDKLLARYHTTHRQQ